MKSYLTYSFVNKFNKLSKPNCPGLMHCLRCLRMLVYIAEQMQRTPLLIPPSQILCTQLSTTNHYRGNWSSYIDISNLGPSEENHDLWREIVDSNDSLHISPNMVWKQSTTDKSNIVMQFYDEWGSGHYQTDCFQLAFTGFEGKQELSPIQLIQPSISTRIKAFKNTRKSWYAIWYITS